MAELQEEKFSGQLLSEARKKRRLRYKRLSTELNIPEKYLQALEEENYEVMPGGDPYIKGYLRSYAKKLGLDPDFIIERYQKNIKNQNTTSNKQYLIKESKFIVARKYIVGATLFFSFSLFIYLSPSCSEDKSIETAVELNNSEEPVKLSPILEEEITAEKVNSLSEIQEEDITVLINLKDETAFSLELNEILKPEDLLEFYFSKECWVSVENELETLVYKLAGEETSLEVSSKGPFKVVVGNAKHANLIFNGTVIDLLESSNRENNVSCVVLPSGKCSEFPRSK
jgi:arsenate reductase-like glutaredoxin family protein